MNRGHTQYQWLGFNSLVLTLPVKGLGIERYPASSGGITFTLGTKQNSFSSKVMSHISNHLYDKTSEQDLSDGFLLTFPTKLGLSFRRHWSELYHLYDNGSKGSQCSKSNTKSHNSVSEVMA